MQAPKHPHGGPVPRRESHQTPKLQARSFECDRTRERKSTVAIAAVFMFACLAIAGTVIVLVFLHRPRVVSLTDIEQMQVADIKEGLDGIARDPTKSAQLHNLPKIGGLAFYDRAFKHELLDSDIVGKIVSPHGGDSKAESTVADKASGVQLADNNCSYTAPRADELLAVLEKIGAERTVVITFNSRNWNNYPDHGVVVIWSDETKGEWLTFDEARDLWGITEEEWADPAGKLFGKKAPFQHTYE